MTILSCGALFLVFLAGIFLIIWNTCNKLGSISNPQESLINVSQELSYEHLNLLRQDTAWRDTPYMVHSNTPVPTNQWYSSVAFTSTSEPMFAYPLAVKMNSDGFGISYPDIVSTADTVFGSYRSDVNIIFENISTLTALIETSDDFSVAVSQKDDNSKEAIANIRVTHGSPYIFASISSKKSFDIILDEYQILKRGDNFLLFSVHGKIFAFFFNSDTMTVREQDGKGIAAAAGNVSADFSIALLPSQSDFDIFQKCASDPIIGTKSIFNLDGETMRSRFEITTRNHGQTLFALLPRDVEFLDDDPMISSKLGVYKTLRGVQPLYKGSTFSFTEKIDVPLQRFPVSTFSDNEKEILRRFVREDTKTLLISEKDTYFLGKKLFALANVLDIAEQLTLREESEILKTRLKTELEMWRINTVSQKKFPEKYFSYDPTIRGIVGEPSSFGSELFNDHNFHYGYFIFAASILSRYDSSYLRDNEAFINLLVKDIANIDRNDNSFPYIRGFDAYEGHSWASGGGLFADGNNQESSSEAVNAWYALYLWSEIIHNEGLREASLYLYSKESSSALEDYLNIDQDDFRFVNFRHTFVSLVWGGKLDSATWFSPKPEARLGIQILPISPGSLYLGRDVNRVKKTMSVASFSHPTLFKDYLAAYQALYDLSGARENIESLSIQDIDSADSRSLLETWLLTLQQEGV